MVDDQTLEASRTLHAVRAMCGILRHTASGISDVDPLWDDRSDIQLASRRRGQREMKHKKSNVANLLEALWVRGKALPRGNRGTPWNKAPNDCDHPPSAIQKGGNAAMYHERCELCGNRRQRIPLTMVARLSEDNAKQSHSALVNRETTGRDRTLLLSTRTRQHDDAGHATAESLLGVLDMQYDIKTQCGRVRRSPSGPGGTLRRTRLRASESVGAAEMRGPGDFQLIDETGQRPERQIATLGLVPRQKGGIERTSDGVFLRSRSVLQLDGSRIPTDEVRPSSGAPGH